MALRGSGTIDSSVIIPGRTLRVTFSATSADTIDIDIDSESAGKLDLDNPSVSENIATDDYQINTVAKTGIQTLVDTNVFKITITRTTPGVKSVIKFTYI